MRARIAVILTILGLLMAFTAAPVAAASLTVNSTADTPPADDGSCTLREAITAANSDTASGALPGECAAGSGADNITFSVTGTIALTSGLGITSDLSIAGAGAITISGNSTFRILAVSTSTVTLSGITIAAGWDPDFGGGILNSGTGTLTVTNSTISGNKAGEVGGGIANFGGMIITNSTISGNGNPSVAGGGIFNAGTMTVTNSTISGNTANFGGGGILSASLGAVLTVTNSTISGNTSTGPANGGGGIASEFGAVTVTNSTISGNTSNASGGGIMAAATETLVNTVVAGNTAPVGPDIDFVAETITTSVIGVPVGKTLADILVPGGLANNGGPTQTIALAVVAGNPAIDSGTSAVCAAAPVNGLDQRGLPRPAACDIGAYEIQPVTPLPNAAMAQSGAGSAWVALGFAILLIGSLSALAVANLGVVRRRR